MLILGIETSCDETAAAVVKNGIKILSNVVASSSDLHTKTGGIIPEVAARQQIKSIIPVIRQSLIINHKPISFDKIDAIAVTIGPGLIGSLLVGIEAAKTLSYIHKKPLIPVNHLLGHIYATWLAPSEAPGEVGPQFPILAMVVSGGHTDMVLLHNHHKIEWIGGTRDDAAGEAFDKTARLLSLPYPGGPAIASEAAKFEARNSKFEIKLPRPMLNENNFDFSFSGLKTAVFKEIETLKKQKQFNNLTIQQLSYEIQEAIVDVLTKKLLNAVKKYNPKSIVLSGGVASNTRLRQNLQNNLSSTTMLKHLHMAPPRLCTDNAAYIAARAFFQKKSVKWQQVSAIPNLTITD